MKRFILSLFTLSLMIGCNKDNSEGGQPNAETSVFPKKVVTQYTQMDHNQNGAQPVPYVSELTYETMGNRVLSATHELFKNKVKKEFSKFVITYENDLPKTLIEIDLRHNVVNEKITYKYANGQLVEEVREVLNEDEKAVLHTTTYRYSGDKLIEIQKTRSDREYKYPQKITFAHLSATEIQKTETSSYISSNDQEISEVETTIYTLDTEKRVVKSVREDTKSKTIREFQYDDKNNYRYHATNVFASPGSFLNGELMKNNLTLKKTTYEDKQDSKYNTTETYTYTYQYNDKGYPTRVERVYKSSRQTEPETMITEITY